jgi:peptidoglycan/xylan/chitin deacetylase (PgdA/CDA1 family)
MNPESRPALPRPGDWPCVLLYHEVSLRSEALINRFLINLHPRLLETHLTVLHRRFKPIGLDELFDAWAAGRSVRDRVLVTFDDGYRDAVQQAAPMLTSLSLPSVWFVNSAMWSNDRVFWLSMLMWLEEQGLLARFADIVKRRWPGLVTPYPGPGCVNVWAKSMYSRTFAAAAAEFAASYGFDEAAVAAEARLFASPADLQALAAVADIGNHTATHPTVGNLALAEVGREIDECDAAIRRQVGVTPRAFAFPFGEPAHHWSPAALPVLASRGYHAVFSVENDERLVSTGRWSGAIPRHTVPLGPVTDSEFTAYVEGLFARTPA